MENQKYPTSVTLSADAAQHQLLVDGGSGTFAPTANASAGNAGARLMVAQFTAESGEEVSANDFGVDKLIAGGEVSAGDLLIPAAAGKVTALTSETEVAVVAKALDAAAADGDVIRALLLLGDPRIIPE